MRNSFNTEFKYVSKTYGLVFNSSRKLPEVAQFGFKKLN